MMIKSEDDATAIDDISNFTYTQCKDCLVFLEGLYARYTSVTVDRNHHLALVAAFALEDRIDEIVAEFIGFDFFDNEFCDGGISIMILSDTRRKLKTLIQMILLKNHVGKLSSSVILSNELLKLAVSKRIGTETLDASSRMYAAKERLLDLYQ
jgi:hypothetical protein